jgi:hypothetical protein
MIGVKFPATVVVAGDVTAGALVTGDLVVGLVDPAATPLADDAGAVPLAAVDVAEPPQPASKAANANPTTRRMPYRL